MFSVLISVYFKENPSFVCQCLDSVFNQTLPPNEVVLVKDGVLTKELDCVIEEYSSKYSSLRVIALPVNQGLGAALNEGLKYCSNELVARMDTDDICMIDRFEKQIRAFEQHPDSDVIGSWIDEFIESPSKIISTRKLPQLHREIAMYAKLRSPLNHVSVMFKKSKVCDAGGYQPFPLMEDYYLWIRMLLNNAKFYNIQESLVWVRNGKDMYNRRGGIKYFATECAFFKFMYQKGYISYCRYITDLLYRFPIRIMPNRFRQFMYENILRK